MELIFNAEALRPPITGVGYYSYHLLREFVRGAQVDNVHCFTGTQWCDGPAQLAVSESNMGGEQGDISLTGRAVQHIRTAIGAVPGTRTVYDKLMERRFEQYANNVPDAIYHETNYILKPYAGRCVTTVHDLSHIHHPEYHKADIVESLNNQLPATIERSDHIIAVSNVVRDDLLEHFNLPESRVTTVYEGVEERYRPRSADECAEVLQSCGIRYKKYVLLVATLEPRKRVDVLLDAWEQLPESLRREFPLVLAGYSGWRNDTVKRKLEDLIAGGTVMHLGYVDAKILPTLFSGAAIFAYPSVYEGFGLPVLDAMSSGVPVICQAGTSMAEFSRGACLLCDTGSADELADKITSLLHSDAERASWGERGRAEAANFTWQRCAAETAAIYSSLR